MRLSTKRLAQIGFAIGLTITTTGLPAIAQTRSSVRQGLPGRRISGGTRSECASDRSVMALNPANNLGVTMSDRPSVHFLLPEFDKSLPLEFKLRDSQGNTLYTKSLKTDEVLDIVSIQVPEKLLQTNQDYQWYFSVVCNAQERSQNIVLSGWLRQAEPEVASQIEVNTDPSSSLEVAFSRIDAYQTAGLWTDVITEIATLMQQYPNSTEVQQAWLDLLGNLNLQTAAEPIATTQASR